MGLRVIREDKRAAMLPRASAFTRMILMLLPTYTLLIIPVNAIVAACDDKRRALHDRAAGTSVVRAPKRGLKPALI